MCVLQGDAGEPGLPGDKGTKGEKVKMGNFLKCEPFFFFFLMWIFNSWIICAFAGIQRFIGTIWESGADWGKG